MLKLMDESPPVIIIDRFDVLIIELKSQPIPSTKCMGINLCTCGLVYIMYTLVTVNSVHQIGQLLYIVNISSPYTIVVTVSLYSKCTSYSRPLSMVGPSPIPRLPLLSGESLGMGLGRALV